MKYTIYSIIPMGVLSSTGSRSVRAVNTDDFNRFSVSNDGDIAANLTPSTCVFDKSSHFHVIRAKLNPIGAQGLRAAIMGDSLEGGYCARVLYGVNKNGPGYEILFSSFFTDFREWHPVDILIDCNTLSSRFLRFDPSLVEIAYDAYKIKDDYKGQPFFIVLTLEIECSGILRG